MDKVALVMFEKLNDTTKFYTMINLGNGTFDANYGNDLWTKTKNYPAGQWTEIWDLRLSHNYVVKWETFIDINVYNSCKIRLDKLAEVLSESDKTEFFDMYRCLVKWGYLSKRQMQRANELFEKSLTS